MARRSTPTVSDAADRYVALCYGRGGSEGVRYSQRSILRRFAAHVSNRQVGSLSPHDFDSFFYGPGGLSTRCARSTMGKYYQDLRGFLTYCRRNRWCDDPDDLLAGITTTSTRTHRARLRLTEGQLWSMAEAAATPRDAALLVTGMHTGARISELTDLRVGDLSLSSMELRMRILKTREEDVVRVSAVLADYLRVWLTAYQSSCSPARNSRLFPAANRPVFVHGMSADWQERGFRPDGKISNPRTIIRGMADRAGIELEDGDGWHTVRRSVARIFFDKASAQGRDFALRMTSAFLHHKSVTTTEIYLGLNAETEMRDEVMLTGFLDNPFTGRVVRMSDHRKAE